MNLPEWLEHIEQLHPRAWDLGLERVAAVAERLDLVHPATRVVLIAGTNGKGTTCEAIDRLCRAAGLSTGKSTSPHLVRFNERIVVDGQPAPDDEIIAAFDAIEAARQEISLSYFEFASLASMFIFRQRQVDVAILEIGLGGRLDAMNVVAPDVSVITRIALDHQQWLGDTRDAIGYEKAGVMRADRPCIVADRDPPATLAEYGHEIGAKLLFVGRDFEADEAGRCRLSGVSETLQLPLDGLDVPFENLLAAAQAVSCLGISVGQAQLDAALTDFELPGRQQWLSQPRPMLLDVAHNPDSAAWLARRLAAMAGQRWHAVFGMYADKAIDAVVAMLAPHVEAWYLAGMEDSRGASLDALEASVKSCHGFVAGKYDKVADAFDAAAADTADGGSILVFGSFLVVGGVLEHLNEHS